jgi:DNA modification methylase
MLGDCLEQLKKLTDDSVDSIVTDPPYELGFMGKKWDSSGIAYNVELWQECLRVLKPGGHLLAFSGSRTYHRMTVAIEDAGFEIRDQIMWVYGSGYPKSLNISKAISKDTCVGLCTCTGHKPSYPINKDGGAYGQEIHNNRGNEKTVGDHDGYCIGENMGSNGSDGDEIEESSQYTNLQNNPMPEGYSLLPLPESSNEKGKRHSQEQESVLLKGMRGSTPENERQRNPEIRERLEECSTVSERSGPSLPDMSSIHGTGVRGASYSPIPIRGEEHDGQSNRSMSELPQQSGEQNAENIIIDTNRNGNKKRNVNSKYICPDCNNIRTDIGGTALKPAHEPICVARKPLIGTVAQNVLTHGTGGLNIDGCRVVTNDKTQRVNSGVEWGNRKDEYYEDREPQVFGSPLGRFPANFIHDGSDEVIGLFPETASGTGNGNAKTGEAGNITPMRHGKLIPRTDHGSAARFFYCAKASKKDRDEGLERFNSIPTAFGNQAQAELKRGNLVHADGKSGMNKVIARKNTHPTVKPTSLMRYLCKLITPPTGTVLDPFMGSGSTGKAAVLEGFNFIGIERDESYFEIATARIEHATKHGEKSDKKSNQSSTGSSNNTHFDDIFE